MSGGPLRTLFITKEVPYPLRGGGSLRNWQNMNAMMAYGPVALFSATNWSPKRSQLPGIAIWRHCNVEEQRSGWEQWQRRLWWLLPRREPDADWAYSQEAARALDKLLAEFKPDLVIFVEVWLYRYLPVVKRHPCRIIFDNHNVEGHLFGQRDLSGESWRSRLKARIKLAHLQEIEGDLARQADQVWVCSEEDGQLLQQAYGQEIPCYVVPNGVNTANYDEVRWGQCLPPSGLEKSDRNLLFLGQMSYPPNTLAANLLIDEIYPQLKERYPDCRLLLVGRVPTAKMQAAAEGDPDIIVTGSVPKVQPYLAAASVMAVPLRQGSGTRLKILEAFAAGCPVVSTAKGAEGLKVRDGEHLLIRDRVAGMVAAISQLWDNPSEQARLAQAAYELLQSEYSWPAVSQQIGRTISQFR
jgi:glycosyltransferase involved in cell wall biosynthesis